MPTPLLPSPLAFTPSLENAATAYQQNYYQSLTKRQARLSRRYYGHRSAFVHLLRQYQRLERENQYTRDVMEDVVNEIIDTAR